VPSSPAPTSIDEAGIKELFDAVVSRKSMGITAKSPVMTGDIAPSTFPMQMLPPHAMDREPTRVFDLIPIAPMVTGVVKYYVTAGSTQAGALAEGGLKPQSSISMTPVTADAVKIAHVTSWGSRTRRSRTSRHSFSFATTTCAPA
jgi:hypothetical protein